MLMWGASALFWACAQQVKHHHAGTTAVPVKKQYKSDRGWPAQYSRRCRNVHIAFFVDTDG
eukprot:6024774-Pyramimonas_sp.AAC.1